MFIKGIDVILPLLNDTLHQLILHPLRLLRSPLLPLVLVKEGGVMIYWSISFHHQSLRQLLLMFPHQSLSQLLLLLNHLQLKSTLDAKNLQPCIQPQLLHHQIQSTMMIFLLPPKVNISVLTRFLHLIYINICHIFVSLLHPWGISLFPTLSMKLYHSLVGITVWWIKYKL